MRTEPTVPTATLEAMRQAFAAAGASPIDAPILQPLGLLLDLAGETMRSRLFVVQGQGGAEACLRPDFTVAVARRHIEGGEPVGRYLYEGPAFRTSSGGERPEEFVQMGVELFAQAAGPPIAEDAEIIQLAWRAASSGGRSDLALRLGDVGLLSAFIDSLDLPLGVASRLLRVAGRPRLLATELARPAGPRALDGPLTGLLAGLSETEAARLLEEVWALAGVEPVGGRGPAEIAARLVRRAEASAAPALTAAQSSAISDFMAISARPADALNRVRELAGRDAGRLDQVLEGWRARLDLVAQAAPADKISLIPAMGHAFDYYDGMTFEVVSTALGVDRPVASGGRYDGLVARLGGDAGTGAVGCVVRPWRAFVGGEA